MNSLLSILTPAKFCRNGHLKAPHNLYVSGGKTRCWLCFRAREERKRVATPAERVNRTPIHRNWQWVQPAETP